MNKNLLIGLLVGIAVVVGLFVFLRMVGVGPFASKGVINGILNINGVIPQGANVVISQKLYHSSDAPKIAVQNVNAVDGAQWDISDLEAGKTYQVTAEMFANGKSVAVSNPLVVTAPATDEELVFNIASAEKGQANSTISGNVMVNGYIPSGSTISVQGRVAGQPTFTTVASNLPGQKKQFMSYTTAITGESYEVVGLLYNANGQQIGSSPVLVVTAPAANEILTINSNAIAPTPTPSAQGGTSANSPTPAANQTVSGTINFNGVAPVNSRIVILQKVYNTSNYQVAVNNVSPVNGATWSWNGAQPSTWYDFVAVLKQRQSNGTDQDIADSQMISVAAPASNVQLSINSGVSNPAPTGQISMLCGNQSGNQWNGTLTIPWVSGAQSYWYQVGTSNGGNNIANSTINGNGNNNVQVNVSLPNQQTLYFQYAYANVANVGTGNSQFSPFSSTSQGACGY